MPTRPQSTFCPAEQCDDEAFLQFGSCCSDAKEEEIQAKFEEVGALSTASVPIFTSRCVSWYSRLELGC